MADAMVVAMQDAPCGSAGYCATGARRPRALALAAVILAAPAVAAAQSSLRASANGQVVMASDAGAG
jgi:hypothetical protein